MNGAELLNNIIQNGTVAAVAILLGRKMVDSMFSKDLEAFKAKLENQTTEFNIRFQAFHTERAQVIKTLFQKIVQMDESVYALIKPMTLAGEKSPQEKAAEATESINGFISYYQMNVIYLDEALETKMESIIKICRDAWLDYDVVRNMQDSGEKGYHREWGNVWIKYKEQSETLKKQIIRDFRLTIGISNK